MLFSSLLGLEYAYTRRGRGWLSGGLHALDESAATVSLHLIIVSAGDHLLASWPQDDSVFLTKR